MRAQTIIEELIAVILVLSLLFTGVTMITSDVAGANITNQSVLARVYVWNTEPNLYSLVVSPSSVNLVPGNTTTINCTGYVYDYNSWGDINHSNATIYHSAVSSVNDSDDNNWHYTNDNCTCVEYNGAGTNASCTCLFEVEYYAYNGTWECNMTVADNGGNATERIYKNLTSSRKTAFTVNTVIGIETPDSVDYGNLSVTETSESRAINVTNYGNVPINVSVRGFGGSNETAPGANDSTMFCEYGNISWGYQRYAITNTTFDSMINLTNTTKLISDFKLYRRENDSAHGNASNMTYWRLQVPLSVGGVCNGTIVFSATDAR